MHILLQFQAVPIPYVVDFQKIEIDYTLGTNMTTLVNQKIASGATFSYIDPSDLNTISPSAQKGGGNSFTCVGLIEWAAEQAGHNSGQGFIPNSLEKVQAGSMMLPFLSPQLLYYFMKSSEKMNNISTWFRAFFDPVDFIITDPLGRKIGCDSELGELNQIPGAFFSGNGSIEQLLIPNPLPGRYQVLLEGVDKKALIVILSNEKPIEYDSFIEQGTTISYDVAVYLKSGVAGDLNNDRAIDLLDLGILDSNMGNFVPMATLGDLDHNGIISPADREIMSQLIDVVADYDNDGIATINDNCQNISNADQTDLDNDGVGNACDNCPNTINPDQTDDNFNGRGDVCELNLVPILMLLLDDF